MRYAALLAALLATACSTVGIARRDFLNTLVGQSEPNVVQQLGPPAAVFEDGGHRYLVFVGVRPPYAGALIGGGVGVVAFAAPLFPPVCETKLDVLDNKVVNWSLRGNGCA